MWLVVCYQDAPSGPWSDETHARHSADQSRLAAADVAVLCDA
jgi:hypothetical protein